MKLFAITTSTHLFHAFLQQFLLFGRLTSIFDFENPQPPGGFDFQVTSSKAECDSGTGLSPAPINNICK